MIFFTKTPFTLQKSRFVKGLVPAIQLLAFSSVLLAGCSSTGLSSKTPEIPASQTFNALQYDTQNAASAFTSKLEDDVFRQGDTVTVTVNGFEEFSGIYSIDKSGEIFLGHIGKLKAAGLTIPELQTKIHQNYSSCCLVKPNISVEREKQAFGKIVVDGAVNKAGVFDVENVIKLSEAVALAGGISETANPEMTILSREINGERRIASVNLTEIQQFGGNDPLIYPTDVVYVQDSKGRLLYKDFVKTLPLISAVILATTR